MAAITRPADLARDPNPKVNRYGLFDAAVVQPMPEYGETGGIRYKDAATVLPAGFEVLCESSAVTFSSSCGSYVTGTPFQVQATMTAGSVGMSQDEIVDTLTTRLLAGEQSVVERVFSQGTIGQANSLANNATSPTLLAGATTLRDGIGALEEWLATVTSVAGIIHLPMKVGPYLDGCGVTRQGRRLVTSAGNIISLGNYANLGPSGGGAAAGHIYAYACETTTVFRTSEIFVSPYEANLDLSRIVATVDSMQNQIHALARRGYVVTHNNVFAVLDVTVA